MTEKAMPNRPLTLGEVVIPNEVFDLDIQINQGYQSFSAELLRLSLLALSALAIVWLKLALPNQSVAMEPRFDGAVRVFMTIPFGLFVFSAASALLQRYTAADSLAYHLTILRRLKRDRPAKGTHASDRDIAMRMRKTRDSLFAWSGKLLFISGCGLIAGVLALGYAMYRI